MKIKALLLMFFCAILVVPIAADEGMDEAARQHLRDKYTIPADSFRPVIQLFEDGSQSFVCDKVELDYYYTLLQDDLDEGIDNYQNYAYIIDTAREEPVIRTNRYDMRGILRKQMIAMPQLDVTRPKRLPFKIRSLKKDEGLTQWYIDVNDDYRGVQKDGKGTVNYDIYLSPFHIENYEHNNLIFNELVDVTISVIRAQDGKEPEIKRYTLTKSKPKITFVGGRIEVSHEQGMKHIRLVDDGSFGYGQLKFEVEGSGASITKDPSKPLNDLPMGLRARFDMFDSKRMPTNFSQLDEVRILEEHNTPRGTMVHHVYSNDRNYGCSLTDLKQKHDKYVDSIVNRMVTRFKQLDESSKQSLFKKHDVKTSQDLADLMEHYDLNIYPFELINKFPQQESSKHVIKDVEESTEISSKEVKVPVEKIQSDNQQQSDLSSEKTKDLQTEHLPDNVTLDASKPSESKSIQIGPIKDTEQIMEKNHGMQTESSFSNTVTNEPKPSASKTFVSTQVEPNKEIKLISSSMDMKMKRLIQNEEVMPESQSHLEQLLPKFRPFESLVNKDGIVTTQQDNSEPILMRSPRCVDSKPADKTHDSLMYHVVKEDKDMDVNTSSSQALKQSIPQDVESPVQMNLMHKQAVEHLNDPNHQDLEAQALLSHEAQKVTEYSKNTKDDLKPLHSKPKYLPATGVTEQSSWLLGSLLCILGILFRHKR
ncbi:Uncharacterised protein [Erysipelothrix amsterdamensis]|uniref:LPXTG cell wall anchor domain-containing protein n=1 Tax=Erysipelothrix amsterdamensis TaxID=2929157 RepID=A0AAU9VKS8_9FIRM|nr:Uncharacterised protein [Erysipelothrix sp. A18Y020d]CAH2763282.1 Uncharacterised protein [Erysipelothrix sp. A18Y020d]